VVVVFAQTGVVVVAVDVLVLLLRTELALWLVL
jgi:hypothetical protein